MQQLSPADALFVHLESGGTPGQIAWLGLYDPSTAPGGRPGFEAIVGHIEQRLHTAPLFRRKLASVAANMGDPYWIDDPDFDLAHHLRQVALPAGGGWPELWALVGELFERPFDLSRPLWEFTVIDGLDDLPGVPPSAFGLLAKLHHAAVDGVAGTRLITALHTTEPDNPPLASTPWYPQPEPGAAELLLHSQLSSAAQPGRRLRTIARSVPAFRHLKSGINAGEIRKPQRRKVPPTRFSGPIGPQRALQARRFDFDAIRAIRRGVPGATINDVMLAIVAGTLRRYLQAKDELPDIPMIAACPVSIRTDEQRDQLGNQVGNMFVSLPTNIADPIERLRKVHEDTIEAKRFNETVGTRTLAELNQLVPGAIAARGMRLGARLSRSGAINTTVTNVPGPPEPLYLAGSRMTAQFAMAPLLPGLGTLHFVLSYCGEVTLTVVADGDKLTDPTFYAECMQRAFDDLRAAVSGP